MCASHIFTNAGRVPAPSPGAGIKVGNSLETLLVWRSLYNSARMRGPLAPLADSRSLSMKRKKPLCSSSCSSKSKERTSLLYGCSGTLRCSRNKSSSATWGIGREGGRAPPSNPPSHWNPFFHPKIREGNGDAICRARPICHELWNAAFRPSLRFFVG